MFRGNWQFPKNIQNYSVLISISEGYGGGQLDKYEKYIENQQLKTPVLFCKYLRNESLDLHEIFCGDMFKI